MASDTLNMIQGLGGEQITYTPFGGVAKTIWSIVDRDVQVEAAYDAQPDRPSRPPYAVVDIYIANDAIEGVATITQRKDAVNISPRLGGAAINMIVAEILSQDNGILAGDVGVWHLRCQG